jgi:hypothetical protein
MSADLAWKLLQNFTKNLHNTTPVKFPKVRHPALLAQNLMLMITLYILPEAINGWYSCFRKGPARCTRLLKLPGKK